MGDRSRGQASSPLASVHDIQNRLLRPFSTVSSQHTQSLCKEAVQGPICSQLKENQTQLPARGEVKEVRASVTKKLDDYLDPILLSQTCAEIGHSNTGTEAAVKLKREARDFDWPDDELKVFMEEVPPRYEMKRAKGESNEESGDGAVEFCTPFKRFEETARKRFEVVKDDENRSI